MKLKKVVALILLSIIIISNISLLDVSAKENMEVINIDEGTELGGVIHEDMVLTKDKSPYEIDTNVQVADGVTITVEPGVTLQNGNVEIFGSGKLIVNGQSNENAVLNNVTIDAGKWNNATVIINNATLNKVKYYSFLSGELSIVGSELYETYIKLYEPSKDCLIERNLFTENSTIYLTSTNHNTLIKDNTFKNETKTPDINYNYTNKNTQKIKIEGNNFLVVDKIVIKIEDVRSGDIIDAKNNYWRTDDHKLIDEMIYDGKDDYKSNAIVNYDPVLSKYNMQAPIVDEPPLKLPVIDESVTNKLRGVIGEDMVLTKDKSPYEIDTNVQVADGVTITVEPGVTLQNGNVEIFGSGKLIINGQSNENAVLNNVTINAGNWSNATVIINNATLNKVKYYSFVSGKLSIVGSELYETYIKLYEPSKDCLIERNLFTENSTINLTSTNNNTLIKDNTFKNETKTPDINYNYTNQSTQKIKIEGNNFLVVDKIVIKIEDVRSGDIIDAKNNYWRTDDHKLIDEMIYDGKDDYKSNAIVNYDPVLSKYNMQAPIVDEPPLKLPVIDESVTNKLRGVIREDMVLTKDKSPYEIDTNVQVADGVTITVEPGVTLQNGNVEIFGSGKLIINGQSNENAVLNNVTINAGNWSNATVIINNATLNKVRYFSSLSGKLSIVGSELYETYIKLYEPSKDCLIERNLFTENSTINLTSTNNNTLIKDNTFKNETKTPDINYNYTNQSTQKIKIEGNNFLVVDKIVLKIEDVHSGDIIDAKNNYWGTTDYSKIDSLIYDVNDDYNSNATVEYKPILTEINDRAPIINEEPVINGVDDISLFLGDEFNPMSGVTAFDNEDGDLTDRIAIIGEVDTMNVGEYTLIYIVEDSYGNRIEYVRKVTVNYNKSDVNKDNKIDILDLALVAQSYNKISSDLDWNQALDINNDGIIDIFDIVLVSNKIK